MQTPSNPVLLLATGGTLDKDYFANQGELGFYPQSQISQFLEQSRVIALLEVRTLAQMDSLAMGDDFRHQLALTILQSHHTRVLITHGTDTMAATARYLHNWQEGALQDRTIVLTGAMRPVALGKSDGLFNLGYALARAQSQQPGVYVAMNGLLFHAQNVEKNRELGVFMDKSN